MMPGPSGGQLAGSPGAQASRPLLGPILLGTGSAACFHGHHGVCRPRTSGACWANRSTWPDPPAGIESTTKNSPTSAAASSRIFHPPRSSCLISCSLLCAVRDPRSSLHALDGLLCAFVGARVGLAEPCVRRVRKSTHCSWFCSKRSREVVHVSATFSIAWRCASSSRGKPGSRRHTRSCRCRADGAAGVHAVSRAAARLLLQRFTGRGPSGGHIPPLSSGCPSHILIRQIASGSAPQRHGPSRSLHLCSIINSGGFP